LLRKFADRSAAKGQPVRETVLNSIAGPVALALLTLGIAIGLTSIALSDEVRAVTAGGIRLLNIVAIAWFLFNLVELVDLTLRRVTSRSQSKLDDQLVPLVRKTLRLFLLIVFVLFAAENVFGANISAWLAGLGIAGLAVSLAAQDSIRNFFGSLTIFVDRPFQVGDL
ncbi:MAG TPA: mechanosensitive ion channel, partial [Tepidisphaeraceae bacterium]|nr:mechanosensitive ion channel [Tepidisphaeraceae bacterium]